MEPGFGQKSKLLFSNSECFLTGQLLKNRVLFRKLRFIFTAQEFLLSQLRFIFSKIEICLMENVFISQDFTFLG